MDSDHSASLRHLSRLSNREMLELLASTLEQTATASDVTVAELVGDVTVAVLSLLVSIVAEAMAAPLPEPWMECEDSASGRYYYYCNAQTPQTTWEHPLDRYYCGKLKEIARACVRSEHPATRRSTPIATMSMSSSNARELHDPSFVERTVSSTAANLLLRVAACGC